MSVQQSGNGHTTNLVLYERHNDGIIFFEQGDSHEVSIRRALEDLIELDQPSYRKKPSVYDFARKHGPLMTPAIKGSDEVISRIDGFVSMHADNTKRHGPFAIEHEADYIKNSSIAGDIVILLDFINRAAQIQREPGLRVMLYQMVRAKDKYVYIGRRGLGEAGYDKNESSCMAALSDSTKNLIKAKGYPFIFSAKREKGAADNLDARVAWLKDNCVAICAGYLDYFDRYDVDAESLLSQIKTDLHVLSRYHTKIGVCISCGRVFVEPKSKRNYCNATCCTQKRRLREQGIDDLLMQNVGLKAQTIEELYTRPQFSTEEFRFNQDKDFF